MKKVTKLTKITSLKVDTNYPFENQAINVFLSNCKYLDFVHLNEM